MFLDVLLRRNPGLVRSAVELHQRGDIPANTYVLDLDAIGANARLIADGASQLGLRVYAMTKQFGRNPVAIKTLIRNGIKACVAVDMQCARAILRADAQLGHIGHLVQIPVHEARPAAGMHPEFWTVFSTEKAVEAAAAAMAVGRQQPLLARVYADGDRFYPGHEGGFPADTILQVAEGFNKLEGAQFAGVTTFPALLFDDRLGGVEPTPNLATLERVAAELQRAGWSRVEVNAPGTTSVRTLSSLADVGATQVEPGHALTGTTPWHAVSDLPELPAMLYLTEVSHQYLGRAFCFGGGLYVDPVFSQYQVRALVGQSPDEVLTTRVDAFLPATDAIDYYGQLDVDARPGATVIFGFRAQAFVTRALIAPVSGIAVGAPCLHGLWTSDGRAIDTPSAFTTCTEVGARP
jgi:predicted amino acid racemase